MRLMPPTMDDPLFPILFNATFFAAMPPSADRWGRGFPVPTGSPRRPGCPAREDFRGYVRMGDGELQEGQTWEAALIPPTISTR
jgi:transketolase N-terminal domain/subunit